MIFQTFDPYNDESKEIEEIEESSITECFICFENNPVPLKLKNQCLYNKLCDCDGLVHETCLRTWYDKTGQCPICRIKFDNINPIIREFLLPIGIDIDLNVVIIFITIKNTIIQMINIFIFLFIIYSTTKLYFLILNQHLQQEDIYEENLLDKYTIKEDLF